MGNDRDRSISKGAGRPSEKRVNPFGPAAARTGLPSLGDCSGLVLALDSALAAGDAIILGTTRDGGAVCVTVLVGDDRYKFYAVTESELTHCMEALITYYKADPWQLPVRVEASGGGPSPQVVSKHS
jgi:hypothetical protein